MSAKYPPLPQKFQQALSDFDMLAGRRSVLVGFSGGADSALLLTLLSERRELRVCAAHLNHGIRGEEAERDEEFCRRFCLGINIPFFSARIDIPRLAAERKAGIEETARRERYAFFRRICEEEGLDCIATAHNATDNAETVLLRLIRGSGTDGLCGIPPVRDNIIRPLLLCTKEEILSECGRRGIRYVHDSSNDNTEYRRNFIRHRIQIGRAHV